MFSIFSLYKDEMSKVQCEIAKEFELLEHNTIMDTFRQLYREEIGGLFDSESNNRIGNEFWRI